MNMNMQQLAVSLITLVAVFYLMWRYSPRKYRIVAGRLIDRLIGKSVVARSAGELTKSAHCGDGCGACSGCGLVGAGDKDKSVNRVIKTFTVE